MNAKTAWGSPYANQIRAVYDGAIEIPSAHCLRRSVDEKSVFKYLDTDKGDRIPDNLIALRTYLYTCGLISIEPVVVGEMSSYTICTNGLTNIEIPINRTINDFNDKLDRPRVTLKFISKGTRYEGFKVSHEQVILTWKNEDNLRSFLPPSSKR